MEIRKSTEGLGNQLLINVKTFLPYTMTIRELKHVCFLITAESSGKDSNGKVYLASIQVSSAAVLSNSLMLLQLLCFFGFFFLGGGGGMRWG